jgi:hypothetical protein
MAKNLKSLLQLIQGKDDMVHQLYQDTNLKLFTLGRHMREGETRTFDLTMVQDYEQFEGVEVVHEKYKRNPLIWHGEYINVHRDKQGHYQINFRKMELGNGFNAVRIANAIGTELLTAQKMLGL